MKPYGNPMRHIKNLVVRIRDADQPYGTGQGIQFSGDELDGTENPEHTTALDKLAEWLALTMDETGQGVRVKVKP